MLVVELSDLWMGLVLCTLIFFLGTPSNITYMLMFGNFMYSSEPNRYCLSKSLKYNLIVPNQWQACPHLPGDRS